MGIWMENRQHGFFLTVSWLNWSLDMLVLVEEDIIFFSKLLAENISQGGH